MPRKGRKKKGSCAATSNGSCSASQTPTDQPKDKKSQLQKNSTFRSIVQLAKHVVGVRKPEPSTAQMDDTQSTSSVYDTATGTSPRQEESLLSPLSRSARKRQKLRRGGMLKLQNFPIEDLSTLARIVTDKSKPDKERTNAASIINELVEKMSSYVDRLLARKLLSNWGVPAAVTEYGSGLGQEMGKFHEAVEADALLDEEGNTLDDWLGEVARKKSRNLQEVMRLLPTATEDTLGEVQHLLLKRRRSSPTPSDPEHTPLSTAKSSNSAVLRAATPKSSRTFSVIISSPSTSAGRPSLDKKAPTLPPPPPLLSPPSSPTSVPPAPPPPPPLLLGHGSPAAQLPSAGHGPPAPPPPPPPSLLRGGAPPPPPFSMPVQKDTWTKSCSAIFQDGRCSCRPSSKGYSGLYETSPSSSPNSGTVYADIDVYVLPSSEQEELERLFEEKEQTKPILGPRGPRTADLSRIEGNRGVTMAISLSRFAKLAVKEIVDLVMSGRMSDDDAEQLIKGWPTDDGLKKFGSLPKEQTTHDRNVAFVWEIASRPGAAMRIELMKSRLHQEEKLAVVREHLHIWEKAVDAMKNEPIERVLKKLLVWSNFLNQGSSLSQLTEISLCDVNVILQQKSTAERTTIGELLAKTLDLKRADLLPVKAALKETEKCQEETKLGQLEKELVEMERSIGLVLKRIETDASLKADFGDSIAMSMKTVKELMEGVARVKRCGDEHRKFFREEEKTPLEELIRHECTALETLCTAIQVNAENQKASVLRQRSVSLADVAMGMESPFKRNHSLRKTTVAGDTSSLAATLGRDLSDAVAKISDVSRNKSHN